MHRPKAPILFCLRHSASRAMDKSKKLGPGVWLFFCNLAHTGVLYKDQSQSIKYCNQIASRQVGRAFSHGEPTDKQHSSMAPASVLPSRLLP